MSSFNIHGVSVSNGIAIGKANLISNALFEVVRYEITNREIPNEIKRLTRAIDDVRKDLLRIKKQLQKESSEEFSAFKNNKCSQSHHKLLSRIHDFYKGLI